MGDRPKVANMNVPATFGNQERKFAESVKENVDVLTGQRGNVLDRAVTFRDLIDGGIVRFKDDFGPGGDPDIEPFPPYLDVDTPPQVQNLTATGAFRIIVLSWTIVKYKGHDRFEIYRNTSNNLSTATFYTSTPGYSNLYGDNVGTTDGIGQTFYYFVRAVNKNNVAGPFSNGATGSTATDVNVLIDIIEGQILESSLNTALQATISKIDPLQAVVDNTKNMYTVKIQATHPLDGTGLTLPTSGTLSATTGSPTITCNFGSSHSVIVGDIVNIASASSLGGAITASILNGKHIVTEIAGTLFKFVAENGTAAISANASDTGNGGSIALTYFAPYISGFGLSNEVDVDGNPTSAFIVSADKFAVVAPSNASRITGTDVTKMPFYVTSQAAIDSTTGINIPAGVYMRNAFIAKANIVNLIAGNVAADAIRAGVVASGTSILTPSINMGSLNAPNPNRPWDWTVSNSSTRYTNFSVNTSGVMHANYGRLRGMEIRASDDTILLRSGSAAPGTGGSLINNGDFPGEVNEAGAVEYGNGWTGSGTTSFQNGQATIGNGSWIDSEIFPLTSGETLYGELMGPSLVQGSWTLTVLAYGASKNYLGWSNASHITGAAWDAASNIAAGAVNITANSSIAYGKIRITAIGGGTQILHNAYLGKAPRRIAPSYAATYIRNASVDTLQIAGNAATVPTSQDYGASGYMTNGVQATITTSTVGINYGSNVPSKVLCLGSSVLSSSGFGGDWAAAGLELRYNTSNSTAISGSTLVQRVQTNSRKGAPPSVILQKTIPGWNGSRYFFLALEVTGESASATGWWRSSQANISMLGSKR